MCESVQTGCVKGAVNLHPLQPFLDSHIWSPTISDDWLTVALTTLVGSQPYAQPVTVACTTQQTEMHGIKPLQIV
jgi:hypothetical protein